jgi:phage shock protein PspC (stress-responsive transcriptional regulator)
MKKIININFHGRVVPIEETAYDILKQYVESLRKYFDKEEGRDEIINDIESRFAELFSERLKKDATCITDEDVNAIILSMGRPEDFEREEMAPNGGSSSAGSSSKGSYQQTSQESYAAEEPRRLYRSENDRLLGGVCGGLANYLRIDPAIMRILFALVTFGGFGSGLLIYLILWMVLPSKPLAVNMRKRLYRNPDNRVLGGVASGLAAYFHIDVWIPRLIFAFPLLVSLITSIFHNIWFEFDPRPVFITGGFGFTLFLAYIILWIVLPEAVTASEKLEMRGEKVDLESIKNKVKSGMEEFKTKADQFSSEVKDRVQHIGYEAKQAGQAFAAEAIPAARRTGSGIGHAIGVLFKAFFLFIAGSIAFALIMVLIGLLMSGIGTPPFRSYLLTGFWENMLAWLSLVLFLGVPAIALLTWLIRRIIGIRSRNHYLGYVFGSLWVIGLFSFLTMVGMMVSNFRTMASVEDETSLVQPASGKLIVKVAPEKVSYYGSDFFGFNWNEDGPFYSLREDSVMMTTVRVNLVKSPDSAYHMNLVKFSRASNPALAKEMASRIKFFTRQFDSILYLPRGFAITPEEKFRNQQVLVIVEVPVGKRIMVDGSVEDYHFFSIDVNRRHRGWNVNWNDEWDGSLQWSSNVEYVMTSSGLERTERRAERDGDKSGEEPKSSEGYRYKGHPDSSVQKNKNRKISESSGGEGMIHEAVMIRNEKNMVSTGADTNRETDNDQGAGMLVGLLSLLEKF